MDKSAIKNFAVWARKKLIEDITQKAFEIGITEDAIEEAMALSSDASIIKERTLTKYEINQRISLIQRINEKGFKEVIEEVAYTWFNRFIAIRFMEVNEYLPAGVRVLSSVEQGKSEPDIIKQFENIDLGLESNDIKLLHEMLDANDTENLYKYLLVKQCNKLNEILPGMFEEIADYTEVLLPNNLLQEGSVLRRLIQDISEDDFKEQVEIIGWIYQYYISEKKDEVFEGLKKNIKISKENIPAATQLFTPDWIVKYMVENSLGRLWLEGHPNEELKAGLKYYIEEAVQEVEVKKQLDEIRKKSKTLTPEDIKVLDPCMGSGHILVYAFDILYEIYKSAGYSEKDIPKLILENNLYGLDVDDRAAQLAYFAVMMKARSKSRRIFREKITLNICSIQESNGLTKEIIDFFINTRDIELKSKIKRNEIEYLIKLFNDAKEYGSIVNVDRIDFEVLESRVEEIQRGEILDIFELQYKKSILDRIPLIIKQAKIMSYKYDVVFTNPPYMGNRGMDDKLSNCVKDFYPNSKTDFFAVFMERCKSYTKDGSFYSLITQPSWLFLSTFTKLRDEIINNDTIYSLLHMGRGIFGIDFGSTAFVLRNTKINRYSGDYFRLHERVFQYIDLDDIRDIYLNSLNNHKYKFNFSSYISNSYEFILMDEEKEDNELRYESSRERQIYYAFCQNEYFNIPNLPIAYWATEKMRKIFKEKSCLADIAEPKVGLQTGENNKFIRQWTELDFNKIGFGFDNNESAKESNCRWFPYNKGGDFRKWYGNNEYVVNWQNDGYEIKNFKDNKGKLKSRPQNTQYYFHKGITWSFVSSKNFGVRYFDKGFLFDVGGSSVFPREGDIFYLTALLCTKLTMEFLKIQNPTLNFQVGNIANIPVIIIEDEEKFNYISELAKKCIEISKSDWDSFETSWDFRVNPLIMDAQKTKNIEQAFCNWQSLTQSRFIELMNHEEEINRFFIEIYGLNDEILSNINEYEITINKADRERDIKSFISYAIGCMFGRYSIDTDGLVYAGGDWRNKWAVDNGQWKVKKQTKDEEKKMIGEGWLDVIFAPDEDNIIPILDDEYFEDDIVGKFIDFVKVTFGESTLEENLDYIGETLGKKSSETSRQAIRRYFLKDFYKDHVQTYQKKPIYWLFDAGKEDGFKALIYMHRYDEFTVAKVRTDYLHKLQKKYDAEIKRIEIILDSNVSEKEKANARKKKEKIQKQMQECLQYDQVIAHVANQRISMDLDDGVAVNYERFQGIEVPQGEGKKPFKANLLAKI